MKAKFGIICPYLLQLKKIFLIKKIVIQSETVNLRQTNIE
jgi:hypothetical protein